MVTGDYGLTAEAIARRIGIVRGDKHVRVITGVDLEGMDEAALQEELQKDQDVIFARVAPEHKMEVVTALKDLGLIVAVTGDGVNDAPALKKADIGVAMGLSRHRRRPRGRDHDPARRQLRQHHQGGRAGPRRLRQRAQDGDLHLLAQHGAAASRSSSAPRPASTSFRSGLCRCSPSTSGRTCCRASPWARSRPSPASWHDRRAPGWSACSAPPPSGASSSSASSSRSSPSPGSSTSCSPTAGSGVTPAGWTRPTSTTPSIVRRSR